MSRHFVLDIVLINKHNLISAYITALSDLHQIKALRNAVVRSPVTIPPCNLSTTSEEQKKRRPPPPPPPPPDRRQQRKQNCVTQDRRKESSGSPLEQAMARSYAEELARLQLALEEELCVAVEQVSRASVGL